MRRILGIVAMLTLAGCGGGGDPSTPQPVLTTLSVALSEPSILVGASTTATVTGKDQNGAAIATGSVTWTSSLSSVAAVSSAGVVTGVSAGQAAITASAGSISASTVITVTPVPVASVTVSLGATTIDEGSSSTATAVLRDASGAILVGRAVSFSSSSPSVATVNATSGAIVGVSAGATLITAQSEGQTGTVMLTVRPVAVRLVMAIAPSSSLVTRQVFAVQPSVQLANASGAPVPQAGVSISVSAANASIVGPSTAITNAQGVATFIGLGLGGTIGPKTLVFASSGLTSASAMTTLSAGPFAAIVAAEGGTQVATAGTVVGTPPAARTTDLDGNAVAGIAVNFAITGGGGSLTGATATSDGNGIARVGSWTLGETPGVNMMQASSLSLPGAQATFGATGSPRPASCGASVLLGLNIQTLGNLVATQCVLNNAPIFMIGGNSFLGSQPGGTSFYDRYLVDLPAGAIVSFDVTENFSNGAFSYVGGYLENGTFVDYEAGFSSLTINNSSGATRRYQIIVSTSAAGAVGTYTILPRRIL